MFKETNGVQAISYEEVMAETPEKSILNALASAYFRYPGEGTIWKRLNTLMNYGRLGVLNARPARTLFIVGESGSGKSRTVFEWYINYLMRTVGGQKVYPVIRVEVPSNATIKGLNAAINRALGLKPHLANAGTEQEQTPQVIARIKESGVLVILFDEAQHLFDKGANINLEVRRHMTHLVNSCHAAAAIIGTPEILDVFNQSSELRRRSLGGLVRLEALDWNKDDERGDYLGFLDDMEEYLTQLFETAPEVWQPDTALRLYVFTGGLVGLTADIVISAAIKAVELGKKTITHEIFFEVVEEMKQQDFDLDRPSRIWTQPNAFDKNAVLVPEKSKLNIRNAELRSRRGKRKARQKDVL